MTNKIETIYVCANCDAQFSKWNGRCLECGGWGTLEKKSISTKEKEGKILEDSIVPAPIIDLTKLDAKDFNRLETGISEVDRVLGGGIVPGSLILLSGEPGIGKSTILAQIADCIGRRSLVFYISGEESAAQVRNRLARLNCDLAKINFISETNTERILSALKKAKPILVVIDSIQTIYSSQVPAEAGSVGQIRAATIQLLEIAKQENIAIILAGHITKDGSIAGPKSLEHIVDTVIYLESELKGNFRILRATKNRFGSVNELGVFEMTDAGFQEIKNPGSIFLDAHEGKITGSVISCVMEGTRPFLVEIQALVTKTVFGYPQRKASGFDLNRLQVLASVLIKRAKVNLTNQDVILNIVGGLKINEPALDLAVCQAIISSLLNQVLSRKTIVLGEVGLGGEVRNISKLKERLNEAKKLGFTEALIPNVDAKVSGIKLVTVKNLEELVRNVNRGA